MKYFLLSVLCMFSAHAWAQSCSCTDDIGETAKAVQVSPSYKDLVKEKGEAWFNAEVERIKAMAQADPNVVANCTSYIERVLRLMNDKHLVLHDDYTKYRFSSREDYEKFKTTPQYNSTPLYDLDKRPPTDVSDPIMGTYRHVFGYYTIEMVPDPVLEGRFLGVMADTKAMLWKRGQVKFILAKTGENAYEGIFYDDVHVARYVRTGCSDGLLMRGDWVKIETPGTIPFNPYVVPSKPFTYKKLADDTDYLYLGSFYGGYAHKADSFYNAVIPQLKAQKLIIDVRNNTGGGERCYEQLLKHLKSRNNVASQIAIIQNKNCISACEHFITWFRNNKMAVTYGENTSGMLAYGYGNRSSIMKKLSCTGFSLEITEAKHSQFKEVEFIGIAPMVTLNRSSDWIEQVAQSLKQ